MSKAIRTALSLVVSLGLFSALTMAQAGGNADKGKNKEHHSRFAKVAFWRHNKDADKKAKQAQATQAPSKQGQAKTSQIKPASTKQAAGKKDQKQEQRASNLSKPSAKKAPAANKTKPRQKAQDPKTTADRMSLRSYCFNEADKVAQLGGECRPLEFSPATHCDGGYSRRPVRHKESPSCDTALSGDS